MQQCVIRNNSLDNDCRYCCVIEEEKKAREFGDLRISGTIKRGHQFLTPYFRSTQITRDLHLIIFFASNHSPSLKKGLSPQDLFLLFLHNRNSKCKNFNYQYRFCRLWQVRDGTRYVFDIGIWPKGINLIIPNRNLGPKEVIRTNALASIWLKV